MTLLRIDTLARSCIIAAVFFLAIRLGGTPDAPNIKPSETFIALAVLITALHLFLRQAQEINEAPRNDEPLRFILKKILPWLGIFFGSLFLGTAASVAAFGASALPWKFLIAEYARIGIAVSLFLLILYHGIGNRRFAHACALAFLSSVPIAVLARIPGLPERLHMIDAGVRLEGFMGDPNYFASFTLIALPLLLSFIFHNNRNQHNSPLPPPTLSGGRRTLALVGSIFIMSAILWSGSRSGWLGTAAALVVLGITAIHFSPKKLKIAFGYAALVIAIGATAFFMLTDKQKTDIVGRTGYHVNFEQGESSAISRISEAVLTQENDLDPGQDRISLWQQSLALFSKNPLGYGPGYSRVINLESNGQRRVSHSIIFESMLTGGALLLALFAAAISELIITWLRMQRPDPLGIGIFSALIGVLINSLFLDSLSLRWLWALAALVIIHAVAARRTSEV